MNSIRFFKVLMLLIALSFESISQTLTIVDIITQQPIQEVEIFTKDKKFSTISNSKGKFTLEGITANDSLVFKHVSYEEKVLSFGEIVSSNYRVELVEKNITLEEFIVTANRWEEEKIRNPYKIEKLSMKEASFQSPQTSADLLGAINYAYIQKSQLAGGSPMIRGFATNRVMIVVDGVRMNNAIFRTGNIQNVISIDALSLQSTEILFGPGAVMYGSDAIGGVMDFHTLTPTLSNGKECVIKGSVFTRYSTVNKERTGHFDINLGFNKIGFLSSLSYSDFGDLRTGSNGNSFYLRPVYQDRINGVDSLLVNKDSHLMRFSGYSQLNFLQKISFSPTKKLTIDYSLIYSTTSNAPRFDRLYLDANEDNKLDYAEWYYGPQKWLMNRIGVTSSIQNKLFDQLRFIAALQNFEESRHDRKFGNARLRNQTENVDAFSINLDLEKKLGNDFSLFYGGEFITNKIHSEANRININTKATEPTNTRYPDGSLWRTYGVYTNLKYNISSKWIANTGVRFSAYSLKADFDTALFVLPFVHATNKNSALNGSLGIVYLPNPTWQIYLNGATGFRAPNIDDIGKVFESEPGSVVVPNSDLKPEYAYNAEFGTAKTIGNYIKFDFSTYFTYLNDALVRRNFTFNGEDSIIYDGQLSQVQAIQNIAKAYIWGIQGEFEMLFENGIGFKSTFNYQRGEEQGDSLKYYPLRHSAPFFGSTHITYKRKKFEVDFYSIYNAKMAYNDLALSERTDNYTYAKDSNGLPYVPSWYTINLKLAIYLNKYFSINGGVENITDQLYRPYASGISAPGRNFTISLRSRF